MRATGFLAALVGLCLIVSISGTAQGTLLSYWNFNNAAVTGVSGQPGSFLTTGTEEVYNTTSKTISPASDGVYAASSSVDFSDLVGTMGDNVADSWGTFGGTTANAVGATPDGQAFTVRGTGNNDHYITFELSTAGYEDLVLTYDARRQSVGFTAHDWSYSTDGNSFTFVESITGIDGNWNGTPTETVDFSSVSGADNQATLYVRATFTGAQTGTNANTRIDNAQFNATPIPEPTSVVLALLGCLGLFSVRCRRR